MSSKYYVVWEWENKHGRWRPYSPDISQLLERAYTKKLKFANLGDASPQYNSYSVDMNTMKLMIKDTNQISCDVRRQLYDNKSPAAQGAQWQWSGDMPCDWKTYDMLVQCMLEESWSEGCKTTDLSSIIAGCPYVIDFCNLTQTNKHTSKTRSIRRVTQASYPVCLSNNVSASTSSSTRLHRHSDTGRSSDVKTGKRRANKGDDTTMFDSKKSDISGARGLLSKNYNLRSRKDNYQHFRNDSLDGKFDSSMTLNSDCGSSTSGRRSSIDTVSTYLPQDDEVYMDAQSFSGGQYRGNLDNLVDMDYSDDPFYDTDTEVERTIGAGHMDSDINSSSHSMYNLNKYNGSSDNSHFIPIHDNNSQGSRLRTTTSITRKPPTTPDERILHQNTRVVRDPPNEDCPICMCDLKEESTYVEDGFDCDVAVALTLCNHVFHEGCLKQMMKSSSGFLQCPKCKTIHGHKTGTQPNGNMSVRNNRSSLPGHPGCGSIEITYNIFSGTQGPEHPNPGRPYRTNGFPRVAYLPDNDKGRKVLSLLREAWDRRLIFTVGRSVTLGADDSVTWNEIHHKTEWYNSSGHGYPDPGYLDRVISELAAQGVVDSTDV